MRHTPMSRNADGLTRPWIILIIVLSVLVVGGVGYSIGQNQAEQDAQAKYDRQVKSLEDEADKAKTVVSAGSEQNQQTVESLEAENAQLKTKVSEQEQKIADLEKQLEEAKASSSPGSTPATQ